MPGFANPKIARAARSASAEAAVFFASPADERLCFIGRDQRCNRSPDRRLDFFDRAAAIDGVDASRLGGRDGLVAFGHALEEFAVGFLDAVADERQRGLARAQSLL